jgi:hypothetical protein
MNYSEKRKITNPCCESNPRLCNLQPDHYSVTAYIVNRVQYLIGVGTKRKAVLCFGYCSRIPSALRIRTALSTQLRAVSNEAGAVLLWAHWNMWYNLSWAQCGDKSLNPTLGKEEGWWECGPVDKADVGWAWGSIIVTSCRLLSTCKLTLAFHCVCSGYKSPPL